MIYLYRNLVKPGELTYQYFKITPFFLEGEGADINALDSFFHADLRCTITVPISGSPKFRIAGQGISFYQLSPSIH